MVNKRILWLMPYAIIALMFIILPMIFLLVRSLKPVSDDFNNWQLLQIPTMWVIMGRSILVGLITAVVCLIIGFPYAFIVARSQSRFFRVFSIALIISPLFVFTIIKVLALRAFLTAIFSEEGLNNLSALIIGLVYLNLPFMIIPLYSVLFNMPSSLIEASEDLGINLFLTIFKVVIPYALRAIAAGFALVFMLSATSIIVSLKLIPNNQSYYLIGNLLDNSRIQSQSSDAAVASTVALVTLAIMMFIYGIIYLTPFFIRKIKGGVNV